MKERMQAIMELTEKLLGKRYLYLYYVIIIIMINLVSALFYFRIDLTGSGAYSLSEVSREVVATLEEPLTVKVFFSKDLPAPYNAVDRYIADLLEEYAEYGSRNFHYEFIDVEENKNMASDFGIFPIQVREIKDDQVKLRNAYMGVALVHGDLIEKIESVTEAEGLEYRITTLIKKMNGKIDTLLQLNEPIQVTLYASSNLPLQGMSTVNENVREIVKKCSAKNYDKLSYRYIDPSVGKDAEALVQIYGLPPLQWSSFTTMTGDRVPAGTGTIGIVVEQGGQFEIIQVLSRNILGQIALNLNDLEDRITTAVDNLISINPKIGYITGHGERDTGDPKGAKIFEDLLSDMYELEVVDLSKEDIPEGINTIVVNGPRQDFTEYELFKLDQFLMKGNAALFLVDSFVEMQMRGQNRMFGQRQPLVMPVHTGLEKLMESYGVTVNKDLVLDLSCFKASNKVFGEQDIYFAPMILEEGLNDENVITRFLKRIFFLKTSSLSFEKEKPDDRYTVLVSSSPLSWLMKGRVTYNPMMMRPPKESQMQRYPLAVLLSGEFDSAFKDREQPQQDAEGKKKPEFPVTAEQVIRKSIAPLKLIVVGTSEITASNVIDAEGKSPNAIFLHNMIDYLNGNYALPEMRAKGMEFNPLEDSGEGTRLALKILNIAGLPIFVILIGLFVWYRRTARKKRIRAAFIGGGE